MVEWIIKCQTEQSEDSQINILDIGTGSGCIAISLAKNLPTAKVMALDVSAEALEITKRNAKLNEVYIDFKKLDILKASYSAVDTESKLDIIVSNPPYVRNLEKKQMKPNVLDNEPHLALFVEDDNPLLFYEAIIEFSKKRLKENGSLYFEINEHFGKEICNLLRENRFVDIQLKKDIYGKDRMVKGSWKQEARR